VGGGWCGGDGSGSNEMRDGRCVLGSTTYRFVVFVLVCCLSACEFYLISCEVCWAACCV